MQELLHHLQWLCPANWHHPLNPVIHAFCRFVAFFSVPLVAYFMRTRFGYRSLPQAIYARYGGLAALAFGLAVAYRLEQEVWSNSLVVASFYGPVQSPAWWAAAVVSTAIPAFYCFTGGMRASLFTDVFQAMVKVVFVVAVVAVVGSQAPTSLNTFNPAGSCSLPADSAAATGSEACTAAIPWKVTTCPAAQKAMATYAGAACNYTSINSSDTCALVSGVWSPPSCKISQQPVCAAAGGTWQPRNMWSLEGGLDMLIVGLLQGALSYPFFDPVLTDRAFLAEPKTMVWSFVTGGIFAIGTIFIFGFVGVFGAMEAILKPESVPCDMFAGMLAGQPAAVARYFGTAVFSIVNLVFLVSSCTVLDSTFASTSKLFGPELLGAIRRGRPLPPQMATQRHAWAGRLAIVFMAVIGTLPLLAGPTALDATTISGTMVVGLGPPVFALTFLKGYRPLVFHLPFWTGVAFGVVMQLSSTPWAQGLINVKGFQIGTGKNALLLGFNVVSLVCCWFLAAVALLDNAKGFQLAGRAAGDADDSISNDDGDVVAKDAMETTKDGKAHFMELPIYHSSKVEAVRQAEQESAIRAADAMKPKDVDRATV
eukprot:GHRR01011215.1.p1 GENE.GHRR01011215.1~~GHRR01011215.1.p1  ORF type:complete len:596 (+),score=197.04 GHRR01011215.1:814-2601(+)